MKAYTCFAPKIPGMVSVMAQQAVEQTNCEESFDVRESVVVQIQESRLALVVGFSTGILIGAFFLIYVVLAIAAGEGTVFGRPV